MIGKLFDQIGDWLSAADEDPSTDSINEAIKLCSACLLMEVVRADQNVEEAELDVVLDRVQRQFGLSQADAEALRTAALDRVESSVSLYEFTRTLHERMTSEQKATLVSGMWQVAYADGELDMHEDALILKVADLLYVPRSEVMRLKALAAGPQNA